METKILKVASIFENPDELQQAADILAQGGAGGFSHGNGLRAGRQRFKRGWQCVLSTGQKDAPAIIH